MTEIKNKVAPLMGGGVETYAYEEQQPEYTVYLDKDKTLTAFLEEEEYNYDGTYGPIPDENGLVDLSYYARDYISNYRNITTIPEENQKYLDSGLKASNMSNMFHSCTYLTNVDISKIIGGSRSLLYCCIGWIYKKKLCDNKRLLSMIQKHFNRIPPVARKEETLKAISDVYNLNLKTGRVYLNEALDRDKFSRNKIESEEK